MEQWLGYAQKEPSMYSQPADTTLKARGDLLTFTNSLSRLPIGHEGGLLRVNSQSQSGLEYAGMIHPDTNKSLVLGQDAAIGVTGVNNTVVGQRALHSLGSGVNNTAMGHDALAATSVQNNNTAVGFSALSQGIADGNTAVGSQCMARATSGTHLTAIGHRAMATNITGHHNTAIGSDALMSTLSNNNTAIGSMALRDNTGGEGNTAIGTSASQDNTFGSNNVAIGLRSLYSNGNGSNNTAIGTSALGYLVGGSNNTAIGTEALVNNISSNNVAIGYKSGEGNTTGNSNLFIGNNSGSNITSASNNVVIGSIPGKNTNNATFIANVHDSNVSGASVVIDTFGRLGITVSSKRFKNNIKPMGDDVSTKLTKLKPVTFTYKDDPSKVKQYGLIAEQVYEVMPDIVVMKQETIAQTVKETREDGSTYERTVNLPAGNKPYTVQYEKLVPMLLHEIIKLRQEVDALIMNQS